MPERISWLHVPASMAGILRLVASEMNKIAGAVKRAASKRDPKEAHT